MTLLLEKVEAVRRLAQRVSVGSHGYQGEGRETRAELERKVKDLTAELSQAKQDLQWEHIRREGLEGAWVLASRVFEKSPDHISIVGQDYAYQQVNPAYEVAHGIPADNIVGRHVGNFLGQETFERIIQPKLDRCLAGHEVSYESWFEFGSLGRRYMTVTYTPLRKNAAEVEAVLVIARDITRRKQAEKALREAYEFNREVISSAREGIIVYDTNLRYKVWNRFMEEFTGLSAEEVLGAHPLEVFPHLAEQGIYGLLEQALAGKFVSVRDIEFSVPNKGKSGWISARFAPLRGAAEQIIGVIALISDITERKQGEKALLESRKALEKSREELQALTGKLFTAQEEERRRIARDLHDDFNQRLASLSIEVDLFERFLPASTEVIRRELVSLKKKLATLSDHVHRLAYELHPSVLDDLGLEAAIGDCIGDFQKRTGTSVTFTARNLPPLLAPELAGNLFRITQEGLRNVARHARATKVRVRLCCTKKGLGLSIKDNGDGFDFKGAASAHGRLGLVSMQERVRLMNGKFWVRSGRGKGTRIGVWVPVLGQASGHPASW